MILNSLVYTVIFWASFGFIYNSDRAVGIEQPKTISEKENIVNAEEIVTEQYHYSELEPILHVLKNYDLYTKELIIASVLVILLIVYLKK